MQDRYPVSRPLPSREQIKEVLEFAESLFVKVCRMLEIDEEDMKV